MEHMGISQHKTGMEFITQHKTGMEFKDEKVKQQEEMLKSRE